MASFTRSLLRASIQASRAAQRMQRRQEAELMKRKRIATRESENARKAYEKALKEDAKEKTRLYFESRVALTSEKNADLEALNRSLETLLIASIKDTFVFNIDSLKSSLTLEPFNAGYLEHPLSKPKLEEYLPKPLGLTKMIPGFVKKHAVTTEEAHLKYKRDLEDYEKKNNERIALLEQKKGEYELSQTAAKRDLDSQHQEIDKIKIEIDLNNADAIRVYYSYALEAFERVDDSLDESKLAYIPESKQLVIEYNFPTIDIVPAVGQYKYVKQSDSISEVPRPINARKQLYSSVIAQETLRVIYTIFTLDVRDQIDTIVFNGYIDTVDPGTGRSVRPCVITLRTSKDEFQSLNLSKVDPIMCLKTLNASVSKSPADLAPVKPILEFNMVDPRFIQEQDVLSGLEERTNLMDLTPGEFESLITNLFQKMGLETKLTQASRDGGVDCVAYDPRPIFGGKVVIQAKRYKDTVGVSAVRDLYGTVQNEGASKGILVTTSGFGKAAFDFADGKPLELLSGSNLLYLLETYGTIKATIKI